MKLDEHISAVLEQHDTLAVFGLILFTERHPHVVKVLRDPDYWRQFDEISGKTFAIFSAKPLPGRQTIEGGGPPGTMGMMYTVWHEPAQNKSLLADFNLESTEHPLFVVFAQMPDGTILQSSLKLSDKTQEQAYERLKHVITLVSRAAAGIAEQYKDDTENVFNAFSSQIREENERALLLQGVTWLPYLQKLKKWLPSN